MSYAGTVAGSEGGQRASELLERFRTSPYLSLRSLRCSLAQGRLILRGNVPTFYLKQLAQTIAKKHSGSAEIVDQIEVGDGRSRSGMPAKPR